MIRFPALVERSKRRVSISMRTSTPVLRKRPSWRSPFSAADITALVTVDFATAALKMPVPDASAPCSAGTRGWPHVRAPARRSPPLGSHTNLLPNRKGRSHEKAISLRPRRSHADYRFAASAQSLTETQARAVIAPWYSLFNVASRGDVKTIQERVLAADYESCAGYLPAECWGRDTSIKVVGDSPTPSQT